MGGCWHAHGHGPWCYEPGYGWEPGYRYRMRRRIGREERMRDLEERRAELRDELSEISEAIRAMKESET